MPAVAGELADVGPFLRGARSNAMDPIGHIRSILSNYVSPITGEALIAAALRRLRPGAHELKAASLERVVRALDRGIDLFVAEERRAALRAELAALTPGAREAREAPGPLALEIKGEDDIERARSMASGLCEQLGARPSATWKVASGVVALASRLAARPSPGQIEVIPLPDAPRGVRVRAVDREAAAPRASSSVPPPGEPASAARPPPAAPRPASKPPAGALDGAMPTIRRVADRFDVRGVGNRTHVEFDVWFSNAQESR
jgi:hypothetical protein